MTNEWHRFSEVTAYITGYFPAGRRLYRASAPNYAGSDDTQRLTETAVQFLGQYDIDLIISFNENSYTDTEKTLLSKAQIGYHHLPVEDFHAPTTEQLLSAIEIFQRGYKASTLIHCGYGWGRTGTGVTAVQLFATSGQSPADQNYWSDVNHVERRAQFDVLKQICARYKDER